MKEYKISKIESRTLNVLKIIFAIMVVVVHSKTTGGIAGETIQNVSGALDLVKDVITICFSYVCLPGFFLISGILLFRKDFSWGANMKKKLRSVLVPYLILNSFWILFYLVTSLIPQLASYFPSGKTNVLQWAPWQWIDAYTGVFTRYPTVYPLWFLRDLFILNLIAVGIRYLVKKQPVLSLVLLLVIWFAVPNYLLCVIQIKSIVLFGFGCLICHYDLHFEDLKKIKWYWIVPVYVGLLVADYFVNSQNGYLKSSLENLTVVAGLLFWFRLIYELCCKKEHLALDKLVPFGTCIYFFHELGLSIIKKLVYKLLPTGQIFLALEYVLIPVIMIMICVIIAILLKKFLPRTYSLVTGGRT